MSKPRVTIEGQEEVTAALLKVADFNKEAAANEAATQLLPAVRAGTRVRTGLLVASWGVEQGAFINEVAYSVPQEFGTDRMEGSYATLNAFQSGESDVLNAFSKEIENAASKAGFDP